MRITAEEQLMYKVMKAVYDSGIPISFKGSMVLKACLIDAGFEEDTRHTVDIDANWYSENNPTEEQMVESLEKALEDGGIDLKIRLYRMYGEKRSAGFELIDKETEEVIFTMDMDVNQPFQETQLYAIDELTFCGITPTQILADKISTVSSEKIFRRIKDVVDLYYLSKVVTLDYSAVARAINDRGKFLENFDGFINETDVLKHAYDKFRFSGGVKKPAFEEVYQEVKEYINRFLPV